MFFFTILLMKGLPVSPGSKLDFKLSTCIKYASSFIPKLSDAHLSPRLLQLVFAQRNTNKQ